MNGSDRGGGCVDTSAVRGADSFLTFVLRRTFRSDAADAVAICPSAPAGCCTLATAGDDGNRSDGWGVIDASSGAGDGASTTGGDTIGGVTTPAPAFTRVTC